MKKITCLIAIFTALSTSSYADSVSEKEKYICSNVDSPSCASLCKLKSKNKFVAQRDEKVQSKCYEDFQKFKDRASELY